MGRNRLLTARAAESEAAMTVAQLEDRVLALEKAVARLEEKVARPEAPSSNGAAPGPTEDEIIDGVEYDFVPNVPPLAVVEVRARIVAVEQAPVRLSLSDAEWQSMAAMLEIDTDVP